MSQQPQILIVTPYQRAKTALKQWLADGTYFQTLTNIELNRLRCSIPMQQLVQKDQLEKKIIRIVSMQQIQSQKGESNSIFYINLRTGGQYKAITQFLSITETHNKLKNTQLAAIAIFATLSSGVVAFFWSQGQLAGIAPLQGQWYHQQFIVVIIAGFLGISCVIIYKFTWSKKDYEMLRQQFKKHKQKGGGEEEEKLRLGVYLLFYLINY